MRQKSLSEIPSSKTQSQLNESSNGIRLLKLSELVTKEKNSIKRGPFGSSITKDMFVPTGYKIYEQKHAISDDFGLGTYYINEEKFLQLSDFELREGDIIISCSGTIGKIAIAPKGIERGIINQALLKISLNTEVILAEYFRYLFKSEVIQEKLRKLTLGSGIKNFASVELLKQIDFPVPSIFEQKRIILMLDEQMAQIEVLNKEMKKVTEAITDLPASILNAAFRKIGYSAGEII